MTTPFFALVIGVSNYLSKDFISLPAAQSDAHHLTEMLIQMGIPEANILLLNDPLVLNEQFDHCVKKISSLTTPFQLLFYYCGHGFRTEGLSPQSYLIFSDSELDQSLCSHSIQLEKLLQTFCNMRTTAIYVFIDACHVRLNAVVNPKLAEEIQGKKDSRKSLFCLFSSGIFPSYESVQHKYGYFTEALIKAMRGIVHTDHTPEALYRLIQKELKKNNLPQPEMYNIGTHTLDIFPRMPKQRGSEKKVIKAMGALYSCGIVIDEALFCKSFGIEADSFDELEHIGLIHFEKGSWHLHDRLIEIVEKENVKLEPALTKSYWFQQFNDLPGHFEAAVHFVMSIQCFGYEPTYDDSLLSAFKILHQNKSQALEILKKSADIYAHGVQSKSGQYLAEILIELQQFDIANTMLSAEWGSTTAAFCHLLWRTGRLSECIRKATKAINALPNQQSIVPYLWHRGTAHYLTGDWNRAQSDFSFIERNSNNSLYVGRSLCLLGTLTGIRGIRLKESQAKIENSVKLMMKNGDASGAWVGWNNLGEIMWKAGELEPSQLYLKKALDIAQNLENKNMAIETLRNFVQLELRNPNCSPSLIQVLLEQIELLLAEPVETVEAMQIYNTLCTAHLFLNNLTIAQHYLRKAIPLTILSKEYHIYTLSNLSRVCNRYKLKEKSQAYFQRALTLAKEGSNLFAIQQIQHDHS